MEQPRAFHEFLHHYHRELPRWNLELRHFRKELRGALGRGPSVEGRLKSAPSTWGKMVRRGAPLEDIRDVLGFRVILEDERRCYQALEALIRKWPGQVVRSKDYIASPKPNGYRSLHLTVEAPLRRWFEVQIRTYQMHEDSLRGSAAHARYKRSHQALEAVYSF